MIKPMELEQALYTPSTGELLTSPDANRGEDGWLESEVKALVGRFGTPPPGASCPEALFVGHDDLSNGRAYTFIVRASDASGRLRYHFLIIDGESYRTIWPNPFAWADEYPVDWHASRPLTDLPHPTFTPKARTTGELATVLREGEAPFLLAAAQALVDGGKLFLRRDAPDPKTIVDIWSLLPYSNQAEIRPCTFSFSTDLRCELMVTADDTVPEGYLTDEQVLNYPDSRYERHLQIAIESDDQAALDGLLSRRSGKETLKLAIGLVILFAVVSVAMRILAVHG